MRTRTDSFDNSFQSKRIVARFRAARLQRPSTASITDPEKHEGIAPPTNSFTNYSSRWWRSNCTYYLNSRRPPTTGSLITTRHQSIERCLHCYLRPPAILLVSYRFCIVLRRPYHPIMIGHLTIRRQDPFKSDTNMPQTFPPIFSILRILRIPIEASGQSPRKVP